MVGLHQQQNLHVSLLPEAIRRRITLQRAGSVLRRSRLFPPSDTHSPPVRPQKYQGPIRSPKPARPLGLRHTKRNRGLWNGHTEELYPLSALLAVHRRKLEK